MGVTGQLVNRISKNKKASMTNMGMQMENSGGVKMHNLEDLGKEEKENPGG